jgi:hypothetical protein
MEKIMSKTNQTSYGDAATSGQVREPTRELTEGELSLVSGGMTAMQHLIQSEQRRDRRTS